MNAARRKRIEAAMMEIGTLKGELEDIRDEEQDYFDNMPEALQGSEKGETAQEVIDQLTGVVDSLDDAVGTLGSIS